MGWDRLGRRPGCHSEARGRREVLRGRAPSSSLFGLGDGSEVRGACPTASVCWSESLPPEGGGCRLPPAWRKSVS